MRRALLTVLVSALAATTVFAGGEQEGGTTASGIPEGPLGKYDPPLTVTTWRGEYNRNWPEGQSALDNVWTRAFEERAGIRFEYIWTAPGNEMNAKINVSIASGELPDVMRLPYNPYHNLARSGQLAPLDDLVREYALPMIQSNMYERSGGLAKKVLSYDGVLYGLGKPPGETSGALFVWSRDDWREAVGMPELPQTWDEFIELAYAFANDDPDGDGSDNTAGLGMHDGLFGGIWPMEGFFAAFDAYPTAWIERNGALIHGSTAEENLDALRVLNRLHEDGVLDGEWVTKGGWQEGTSDIASSRLGLVIGKFWWNDLAQVGQVVEENPDASWSPALIQSADGGGPATLVNPVQVGQVSAIRSDFDHPEVLIKLANWAYTLHKRPGTAEEQFSKVMGPDGKFIDTYRGISDFLALGYDEPLETGFQKNTALRNAIAERDPTAIQDDPEQMIYYTNAMGYLDGTNLVGYRSYGTFGPGGGQQIMQEWYNRGLYKWDGFFGPNTPAMNTRLGDLNSKRQEYFTRIIVGDMDVEDGFQEWIDYWNKNGGRQITQEVNEWYAEQ
jgi:putative aldouronate transport system substrate-binding protein